MTRAQWTISGLLVCYCLAVILNSLPTPEQLRNSSPTALVEAPLQKPAPYIDTASQRLLGSYQALWNLFRPLREVSDASSSFLGIRQEWNMFTNPPRANEYVRLRYYVTSGLRESTATELIFPSNREDRFQLLDGFQHSFRNKAIAKATEAYLIARDRMMRRLGLDRQTDTLRILAELSRDPPRSYVPVVRYFSRRYLARHLPPDARLVRTEVWYGFAPIHAVGRRISAEIMRNRENVLEHYYAGQIHAAVPGGTYPPYGAVEREADITWNLFYVEAHR